MVQRTTEEVFEDHLRHRSAGDTEGDIRRNYAEDCVLLTSDGLFRGHDGVRKSAALLKSSIPRPCYEYRTRLVAGEMAFLEWTANSDQAHIPDGADSFCIRDGRIVTMTIHYTVHPKTGRVQ